MSDLLLDTNICIELIHGTNLAAMESFRGATRRGDRLLLSSIVEFELAYGVANSDRRRQPENEARLNMFRSYSFERLAFTTQDASAAATIRTALQRAGTPIGSYDLLIAGQAIASGLTVVTGNVREFSRVPDLKWIDWSHSAASE